MMERRTFLKNIFGVAVVASMPKIVVDQIEALPPEDTTPVKEEPHTVHISKTVEGNCLFLYDEETLIATSTLFSLAFNRQFYKSIEDPSWMEYISGPMEWNIHAERFRWVDRNKGLDYFMSDKSFHCIIHHENIKIQGEVYITECGLTVPIDEEIEEEVMLRGLGELIIGGNDDTITETTT